MTQGEKIHAGIGRIALTGAAAIALVAVGYRIGHERSGPSAATVGIAADPGGKSGGIEGLAARAEANPKDPAAWQELALARYAASDFAGAAAAFEKAAALTPASPELWSALGEARVMASARDPMPAAALEAFRKAIALDPKDPRARYFLGVKRDLDGDHAGAIGDWLALLGDTPPGAPWEADLKRTIEQVGKIARIDTAPRIAAAARTSAAAPPVMPGIPGPTAKDLQAATGIAPGEQREMAEGMVEQLEGKLRARPANPEGWIMLIRSRMTLGEPDRASQALRDALAANPREADLLRQQAGVLGVR